MNDNLKTILKYIQLYTECNDYDLAKIASEIFKKRLTKPHCFNALDNKGMEITSFLPDFFSLGIFW